MLLANINLPAAVSFLTFLVFLSSNQFLPGEAAYLFMGGLVGLSFFYAASGKHVFFVNRKKELCSLVLSFLIVLSWFYGLFIGAIYSVPLEFLFRNFAGMLFYITVPAFFIARPTTIFLYKSIYFAFLFQLLFAIYGFVDSGVLYSKDVSSVYSFSELRSVYSVGYVVAFPVFSVSLYAILNSVSVPALKIYGIKSAFLYFLCSLFVLIVPAMSKGFILGVLVIFSLIFFSLCLKKVLIGRSSISSIMFAIFVMFCALFLAYEFYELLVRSFGIDEQSNSVRLEQARFLINEISFWGAGLGSGLESGYMRGEIPYAFELSYLNVLHKLGVFGVPLLISYVYVFIVSFFGLFKANAGVKASFSLGLMGYAIVGAGNPIILGAVGVMLHSIALYVLTEPDRKNLM